MKVEEKLAAMGIVLKEPPRPVAAYVPAVQWGLLVFTSGQVPLVDGKLRYTGRLGAELTLEQGYDAARICAINCLAAIKSVVGDLDNVKKIIKVTGFVASAPGFRDQPKVVNGASELLGEAFGPAGAHARSAVGVAELPLGAPVEVEVVVAMKCPPAHGLLYATGELPS